MNYWYRMFLIFAILSNSAQAEWKSLLTRLVNVNSGTGNTEGLTTIRRMLQPELERLGYSATSYDVGGGHSVLSFDVAGSKPSVALIGHIDTVFAKGSAFSSMTSEADRLSGPGVIDMKGGIVLMLEVLARLRERELLSQIRVILNDDEEIGSSFSKGKLKELVKGIPYGLVFEPGLPDGSVVIAHSGVRWLELTVRGVAAHAGLAHDRGLNACVELSHKIIQIAELTDYSRRLTVNPGVVSGGTAPNVVCEMASAKIDVRYVQKKDLDELMKKLFVVRDTMAVYNPQLAQSASADLKVIAELSSMPEGASKTLFSVAQQAARSVGQALRGASVGYASDANHLAETGMQVLVGLGPYGGGMHTSDEFLLRGSFDKRLALNTEILRLLLRGRSHGR